MHSVIHSVDESCDRVQRSRTLECYIITHICNPNFKLLKRHWKTKRSTQVYSQVLRRIRWVVLTCIVRLSDCQRRQSCCWSGCRLCWN